MLNITGTFLTHICTVKNTEVHPRFSEFAAAVRYHCELQPYYQQPDRPASVLVSDIQMHKYLHICVVLLYFELCPSNLLSSALPLYILSCQVTRDTWTKPVHKTPAKICDGSNFYEIPSTVLQQSSLLSFSTFLSGLNCTYSA